MQKLIILTIVAILLVGVSVFLYTKDGSEVAVLSPTPTPTPTAEVTPIPLPTTSESRITVTYSDSGYNSSEVKIKKGDSVVFENKGSKMMWTASAMHPTHKVYPGTDIAKCGTSEQGIMFDSCKGYGADESWEFRFNELGTWKYHNHLQPNHFGAIIVE